MWPRGLQLTFQQRRKRSATEYETRCAYKTTQRNTKHLYCACHLVTPTSFRIQQRFIFSKDHILMAHKVRKIKVRCGGGDRLLYDSTNNTAKRSVTEVNGFMFIFVFTVSHAPQTWYVKKGKRLHEHLFEPCSMHLLHTLKKEKFFG